MTGRVASRRRLGAAVALSLMAGAAAGCQHDGRELREPTSPTPPTTTTSTTLPPDIVADTVANTVDPASP